MEEHLQLIFEVREEVADLRFKVERLDAKIYIFFGLVLPPLGPSTHPKYGPPAHSYPKSDYPLSGKPFSQSTGSSGQS
jgi:hypothetical protein